MPRRFLGLDPSRARTGFLLACQLGQSVSLWFYASVCDINFPYLVCLSLLLMASIRTSFSLHAAVTPPPPPPLHDLLNPHLTPISNAVAFQSPPQGQVSGRRSARNRSTLCSFPPRPLRTAPSRSPNMIRFGNSPPVIRMSVPAHKNLLVPKVVSKLFSHPVSSRGHGCRKRHPIERKTLLSILLFCVYFC